MATANEVLSYHPGNGLEQTLAELTEQQRAVFACCCAQRLLAVPSAGGDHPLAARTVDAAWRVASGERDDEADIILADLDALGDELDQDAIASGYYALKAAMTGEISFAGWAASRGLDHAFELADPDGRVFRPVEVDALEPSIQSEFNAQLLDLDKIKRAATEVDLLALRPPT